LDLWVDLGLESVDEGASAVEIGGGVEYLLDDAEVVLHDGERCRALEQVVLGHGGKVVADACEELARAGLDEVQPPGGDLLLLRAIDEALLHLAQLLHGRIAVVEVAIDAMARQLRERQLEDREHELLARRREQLLEAPQVRGEQLVLLLGVLLHAREIGLELCKVELQCAQQLAGLLDLVHVLEARRERRAAVQQRNVDAAVAQNVGEDVACVRQDRGADLVDRALDQLLHVLDASEPFAEPRWQRHHEAPIDVAHGGLVGRRVHAQLGAVDTLAGVAQVHVLGGTARRRRQNRDHDVAVLESHAVPKLAQSVLELEHGRQALTLEARGRRW